MLVVFHEVSRRMSRFVRSHWGNQRNVIIVGEGFEALALASRLTKESGLSYQIIRIIDAKEARGHDEISGGI
jgi:FlaA1/EpsC-like NDP-sugar epimerase